jgi:hypothetical protein
MTAVNKNNYAICFVYQKSISHPIKYIYYADSTIPNILSIFIPSFAFCKKSNHSWMENFLSKYAEYLNIFGALSNEVQAISFSANPVW